MIAGSIEIQLLANLARLQSDMNKANRTVQAGMTRMESSIKTAQMAVTRFGGALVSLGTLRVMANTIDEFTKYTAQLKLATKSQQEFNAAFGEVKRISTAAQADISSIATLYARLSNSLRDAGVSQAQLSRVTETVGLSLKVSGATAQETSAAMLQLSQAFASGVLRGEEFNSIAENAPSLMRALADSIGVPVGKLREMAKEGQITSEVMLKAFADPKLLEAMRTSSKEIQTISGAFQVLKNNIGLALGQFDSATGFSAGLAKAINALSNAIATLADLAQNKRIDLDRVFPGYAKFLQYQQGQQDALNPSVSRLGSGGSQFLSRNARITDLPRIDIGNIGEANAEYEKLKGTLDKLRTDQPLKDLVSTQAKYAENIKTVNALEEKGLLSVQEATRYRAQFNAELTKSADKTNALTDAQKQLLKELQNQIDMEGDLAVDAYNKQRKVMLDYFDRTNEQIVKDIKERYKIEQEYFERTNKQIQKGLIERGRDMQREADRINEALTRSITDGIFRGFENGKSIFENFKDVLINGLKTALVQPLVNNIIKASGIGSLFSSVSAFAGGGSSVAAGSSGGIGNVFGTLKDGLSSLNTNVVGSIEKLGVFLSNGQGGLADKIGGFLGQYSSQIAGALSFAPAVFSLLKGDFKGAAFQGAGAGIGLALGGPVGGAIGSFLGGALGSVFGGKTKNPRKGAGVSSTFADGQFSSFATKGGAKKFTAELVEPLTNLNRAFSEMLGGYLGELGINQSINVNSLFATKSKKTTIAGISGSIGGVGFGASAKGYTKDAQQSWEQFAAEVFGPVMVQAIQASGLSAGLKALFSGMTDRTQILAMMNATIALNKEQSQLADKYSITVDQAAKVAKATGLTGDALVGMVNKLAGAVQTTGSVLMQARESLMEGMGGQALPSTLKAFDDILKGIDKSTQAGIQSFADMFSLREQFAAFTQSIDQLKGGVNSTLMPFLSAQEQQAIKQAELVKVFDSLNMSVPGSLQELIDLGKAIDYTTKEGLDLAAVFPTLVQAFQQTTQETNALIDSLGKLDINKFRTSFEYIRAGAYLNNGISLSQLPSYDVGTPFVPNTGPAMLHQGERVMTAAENRAYSAGSSDVVAELQGLRQDQQNMRAELQAIAINSHKSSAVLDRLDRDGFILRDVDNEGNPQIIPVEVV
jgi:tape measure domain-containing protein